MNSGLRLPPVWALVTPLTPACFRVCQPCPTDRQIMIPAPYRAHSASFPIGHTEVASPLIELCHSKANARLELDMPLVQLIGPTVHDMSSDASYSSILLCTGHQPQEGKDKPSTL